jgi:hypothetical protein
MGTFEARMRELSGLVGKGVIEAKVDVKQLYAQRQHQGANYAHPRGGQAFYLRDALMGTYREHLQRVAMALFTGGTRQQFISYSEQLARESSKRTPVELGNLKKSESATVKEQGRIIYRRPAKQPKMSRKQLNSRIRLHHIDRAQRRLGGGA